MLIRLCLLGLAAAGILALQGCPEYGPVGRQDMDKVQDCRRDCIEKRSRCGMDLSCDRQSQVCMDYCKGVGQKKDLHLSIPTGTSSDQ
jgi:hypothetical protein